MRRGSSSSSSLRATSLRSTKHTHTHITNNTLAQQVKTSNSSRRPRFVVVASRSSSRVFTCCGDVSSRVVCVASVRRCFAAIFSPSTVQFGSIRTTQFAFRYIHSNRVLYILRSAILQKTVGVPSPSPHYCIYFVDFYYTHTTVR